MPQISRISSTIRLSMVAGKAIKRFKSIPAEHMAKIISICLSIFNLITSCFFSLIKYIIKKTICKYDKNFCGIERLRKNNEFLDIIDKSDADSHRNNPNNLLFVKD